MMIDPSAETSATADPEIPANSMESTTFTCASPPRKWPTMACAKPTIRALMPPRFISSPASMKNGIAIRGKLFIPS